jgi:hypothetical protein
VNRLRLAERAFVVLDRMQVWDDPDVITDDDDDSHLTDAERDEQRRDSAARDEIIRGAREGTPFVFSDDLTAVVEAAALNLPGFVFAPSDLRAPSGFVLFATPLVFDEYAEVEENGDPEGGAMDGFLWSRTTLDDGIMVQPFVLWRESHGWLLAPFRFVRFGSRWDDDGGGLCRMEAAALRILCERIAIPETEWVPRPVRRRHRVDYARLRLGNLHLWTLREGLRREHGEQGHALTTRHLVSAHWKQQWYPGEQRHAPILVAAYQRGPKSAPLVVKRRVGVVVR